MFARSVSIRLKNNSAAEFTQTIEKEVLPLLRKQKGFQDELTFIVPGGSEAIATSLWDRKENADGYSRNGYPRVLKLPTSDWRPMMPHSVKIRSPRFAPTKPGAVCSMCRSSSTYGWMLRPMVALGESPRLCRRKSKRQSREQKRSKPIPRSSNGVGTVAESSSIARASIKSGPIGRCCRASFQWLTNSFDLPRPAPIGTR